MKKKPKQSAEKEHLEIIEKKVDIQKKRLDIRKEKQSLKEFERRKIMIDEQKNLTDKVSTITWLLAMITVDSEKTILGSEPMFKPILPDEETKLVLSKLRELLKQF